MKIMLDYQKTTKAIDITLEVSKLDIFIIFNDEQVENIPSMFITFEVIKLDKFIEDNDKQL